MSAELAIIGMGVGNPELLTREAWAALSQCDVIIGARRVLEALAAFSAHKVAAVAADDIMAALKEAEGRRACLVFTGDVGLHSGAARLYPLLTGYAVRVFPGISSLPYFAARLKRPWQSAHVVSGHGVACSPFSEVYTHAETFFLTDGATTPASICEALMDADLGHLAVHVGERLSYPDECITSGAAAALCGRAFSPLSVVWVDNPAPFVAHPVTQGLPDDAFIRGKTPMTKRIVRSAALSLLGISLSDILYDVGAGTGSVSVEMARMACRGAVYAIESDADACALIRANREQFGVRNLHLVSGEAPEAMLPLPAPHAAFVGGSDGRMEDIVEALLEKNPRIRLVISAVTLETLCEAQRLLKERGFAGVEVAQVAVTQSKPVGDYTMMMAQNPVFLLYGEGGA